jgi:hypothetical protein
MAPAPNPPTEPPVIVNGGAGYVTSQPVTGALPAWLITVLAVGGVVLVLMVMK